LPENCEIFSKFASDESIRKVSSLLNYPWNLTLLSVDSIIEISERLSTSSFLYKTNTTNYTPDIILGFSSLDMAQGRAELVYFCNEELLKSKALYSPLKVLLIKAFEELELSQIEVRIFKDDNASAVMLKGFGFTQAGEMADYVKWKGQSHDALLFRVMKNEFRVMKNEFRVMKNEFRVS